MKVKGLSVVLVLLILSSFCLSNSYSFLNSTKVLKNNFNVGENKTNIEEEFNSPPKVHLKDKVTKKVRIVNSLGNKVNSFVRVKLIYSDYSYKEKINLLNLDLVNWEYNNGWYYYKKVLKPGEKTSYLFKGVEFNNLDNNDIKNFSLSVYEESIEARGHNVVQEFLNYKNGGKL